jgi:hypothetical protein
MRARKLQWSVARAKISRTGGCAPATAERALGGRPRAQAKPSTRDVRRRAARGQPNAAPVGVRVAGRAATCSAGATQCCTCWSSRRRVTTCSAAAHDVALCWSSRRGRCGDVKRGGQPMLHRSECAERVWRREARRAADAAQVGVRDGDVRGGGRRLRVATARRLFLASAGATRALVGWSSGGCRGRGRGRGSGCRRFRGRGRGRRRCRGPRGRSGR